ncbi:2,3-bisphosphoglycerate-dependent phosphoglycerate mutase [Periweissella beninensis]|uniref:2,3-bisphosphoglycerate-dependent phosphoglycerate mutase n=1 Tax=Periweissella beninensis TaxID=504936 RepID=A0ABT0VIS3_9LACO|nr:2,3-diphosphoglycerate-dependent phosphoglycerate mutase [Periweissella beninensis]MBM7544357.1 2,3-bisphosphoglycerate-dependent phosphoglycerate mutase [Periweissella beninensis]MCM2437732.1 2,3-diphosphoglycerate-dependent phosphoglycerate mutase [Periweissella beninensis]MCT4395940.1 2,3-diphosphoglycerate-dependent phosphoglycerate mutase [Periweissella beninensis]
MASELIIMRHGQSVANRDNIFTGWSDVALTELGIKQAMAAGQKIKTCQIKFSQVHTSYLKRAIQTTNIVMEQIDQLWVPLNKSWRLNERHYGALRGLNKEIAKKDYGAEQVQKWRRSYTAIPPLLAKLATLRQYPAGIEPRGESLAMAYQRLLPYWQDQIAPQLLQGKPQLVVAHGSTLRALIKYLDQVSDEDIKSIEVGNGEPIYYQFDEHLNVIKKVFL